MNKISTVTVLCALFACVGTAHGAASVRSLGSAGTFNSASSASASTSASAPAAQTAASAKPASAINSVRAGSMRVTPTSNKGGTATTTTAGTTSAGRAASGQRLSIGRYLGGSSANSSVSSSGSGMTPGQSAAFDTVNDNLDSLTGRVVVLEGQADDLYSNKQDSLKTDSDSFIVIDDNDYISVDVENLAPEILGDNTWTNQEVESKIDEKIKDLQDGMDTLGVLAYKNEIDNNLVAENAAIARTKLATDVQTTLNNVDTTFGGAGMGRVALVSVGGERTWFGIAGKESVVWPLPELQ